MNKTSRIIEFIKNRKELKDDQGFSLIELVVAVGILAILSVTGVVAYSTITENASKTATDAAAAEVYTAVIAAEADGNSSTNPDEVVEDYKKTLSSDSIRITYHPATSTRGITIIATELDLGYSVTRGGQTL